MSNPRFNKPPLRQSTLDKAKGATPMPPILKVGTLVIFSDGDQLITGWVIQNSMSPGGQTGSYLVVDGKMTHNTVTTWPEPRRIQHFQVLNTMDIELP